MFRKWAERLRSWRIKLKYSRLFSNTGLRRLGLATVLGLVVLTVYSVYLDFLVRSQFEGARWALPARVYARPLELYPGKQLNITDMLFELRLLGYQKVRLPSRPGTYSYRGNQLELVTRPFRFWDGEEPQLPLRITFDKAVVEDIVNIADESQPGLIRLDPVIIGSIYPAHNEDRVLIKLDELPPLLIDSLLIIEDRHFREHAGIRPQSILRAMMANIRAGATVQGGSTLTQQLVKNFFLTNERTLWRKFNEAIMSLLLEWHYEKDEILEAYFNEIFLGQDGRRAIHGFGLASQFYFQRHISELKPQQIALLVAMVKGASYYDPRRFPERARQRRNLVLEQLFENDKLTRDEYASAKQSKLGVLPASKSGVTRFPAFLDLMRKQLRRDYQEEDLTSQGLQIHTTLDPLIQANAEEAVSRTLSSLEKQRGMDKDLLQAAAVVSSVDGGEILAAVGDRDPRFAGFNRVTDAVRPIGSLIKPAIYLAALERPEQYTLISQLEDTPLELTMADGQLWRPKNYNGEWFGFVPLHTALAKSYNLSTVRLGLELGSKTVIETLRRLGIQADINPYPSMFLGAVELSPLAVSSMYHTLANKGFRVELRSIRAVLNAAGTPLQRYALSIEQVIDEPSSYLINYVLQEAVSQGTGKNLVNIVGKDLGVAGKTGTSDELRDSWFAGFTDEHLAVTWVGNDDNLPTTLTGSTGAMRVWGNIMKTVDTRPLLLAPPEGIETLWIDQQTYSLGSESCEFAVEIPFVIGSAPVEKAPCAVGVIEKTFDMFKGIFK